MMDVGWGASWVMVDRLYRGGGVPSPCHSQWNSHPTTRVVGCTIDQQCETRFVYAGIPPSYLLATPLPPELANARAKAGWNDRAGGSGSCLWGPPTPNRGPAGISVGPELTKHGIWDAGGHPGIPI
jgi:hypothetical protein